MKIDIFFIYPLLGLNEAPRAKARGLLERNTERPFFILALKGKVFWPRMYKKGVLLERLCPFSFAQTLCPIS